MLAEKCGKIICKRFQIDVGNFFFFIHNFIVVFHVDNGLTPAIEEIPAVLCRSGRVAQADNKSGCPIFGRVAHI